MPTPLSPQRQQLLNALRRRRGLATLQKHAKSWFKANPEFATRAMRRTARRHAAGPWLDGAASPPPTGEGRRRRRGRARPRTHRRRRAHTYRRRRKGGSRTRRR